MRKVRYSVAMSLDGFVAAEDGGYDWIVHDPSIDFASLFAQFDTMLMGRKTYEVVTRQGGGGGDDNMAVCVFSRTAEIAERPGLTVIRDNAAEAVSRLKSQSGKDIWLFGGGSLFRSLLEAGQVDQVEVAVIPVLLGGGIPLLPSPAPRAKLELLNSRALPSGIVMLEYRVSQ